MKPRITWLVAWALLASVALAEGEPQSIQVTPPPGVPAEEVGLFAEGSAPTGSEGRSGHAAAAEAAQARLIALLGLADSVELRAELSRLVQIVTESVAGDRSIRVRAQLNLADALALVAHYSPAARPDQIGPEIPQPTTPTTRGRDLAQASEEQLRTVLETAPDDPEALQALGLRMAASGRLVEALSLFDNALRALGSAPEAADVRCNIGAILFSQRRVADALEQYRLALQANANAALARYGSGACYEALGEVGKARAEYSATLFLVTEGSIAEAARSGLARLADSAAPTPPVPGGRP